MENKEDLETNRYRAAGKVLGLVTSNLKWAEGLAVKTAFDEAILNLLGPKTEADSAPIKVAKAPKEAKASPVAAPVTTEKTDDAEETFEVPDEKMLSGRDLEWARNTEEILAKVRARTQGRVITRFPPEPNGYLHIGHAKAMAQNFGVAAKYGGQCIMRFDDTNPEAEEQEYIDTILENLTTLGHVPAKTTFSSDYFEELFDLAVQLIKKDRAYVCHQTKEEIRADRAVAKETGVCPPSPFRSRSIEENLRLFTDMRKGKMAENECTLRMKGILDHPNPNMWDTVFYRIRYTPHPHTGDRWCIYPTYDYTHCIIDSLEDITYSMCTLEFEVRRESYYWLLNELGLYKPKVWEYSRLNITHNVLSKRRLRSLVMDGHVRGWDDPRLLTINGIRRRGIPAEAINNFIKACGVSRNTNMIPYEKLEGCARDVLNVTARRAMAVIDPIRVTISNFPTDKIESYKVVDRPNATESDFHNTPLTRVLYIERDDFMVNPTADFIRLSPGAEVRLKGAFNITVTDYVVDSTGNVKEITALADFDNKNKPKATIHWVAEPAPGVTPLTAEVRLYNKLFRSEDPMSIAEWEKDLNPESLIIKTAFVDPYVADVAKVGDVYQFERVGYFAVDPDTEGGKLVFNRTCELRQANATFAAKKISKK